MDTWVVVSAVAAAVYIFFRWVEGFFGDRKKIMEIRERIERAKEEGDVDEGLLLEATTEMNKILLRRILISVPVLLPLLWVVSLGEISTPLGEMGAIWWYFISYIVVSGGVALGSSLQKKAKAGGRKDTRR